jgi:PLP dependent protein
MGPPLFVSEEIDVNTDLADRLAAVDADIADAARRADRDPSAITRIVVTKFHPASLVSDLYELGVRDVGENRQQELSAKVGELAGLTDLTWHFIGQAQTNKARQIRAAASVVHSVDRDKLAAALSAAGGERVLDVLLQVNLTDDPARGGVTPGEAGALADAVASREGLRIRGVMAVAPLDENPARAFAVRAVVADADWISAGMSGDYAEAIAMGATHLRIGSAITGPRPLHG